MDEQVGTKADAQKLRPTLLPPDALIEVVKVLEFGARKYAVGNWKHVPDAYQRYEDAGFRHRLARIMGEELDPESGLYHLAHEACCILFQLWFKVRAQQSPERDDEPRDGPCPDGEPDRKAPSDR